MSRLKGGVGKTSRLKGGGQQDVKTEGRGLECREEARLKGGCFCFFEESISLQDRNT